jgi:hypothetical protein
MINISVHDISVTDILYQIYPVVKSLFESHFNERTLGNPGIQIAIPFELVEDAPQHAPALSLIQDCPGACRQVCFNAAFQVECEIRVGAQVSIPAALAGRAGDIDLSIQVKKPDLDPARYPCFAANRGDIDRPVCRQGTLYFVIQVPVFPFYAAVYPQAIL